MHLVCTEGRKEASSIILIWTLSRYAIGYAERSGPKANIGWLSSLANATDQPYAANNTGGPTLKVGQLSRPTN